MSDHDDFWDFYDDYEACCEDHYEEGYDAGWEDCYSSRRHSRSSSSVRGSDGCYIATAVYGSYDCPEVWVLRRFRDYGLRKSAIGSLMVRGYYAVSPGLVERFGHVVTLKRLIKGILDVFVWELKKHGFEDTAYYER